MSDVPFHLTRMGARYYEHTVPELVRQIAILNETLAKLLARIEANHEHDEDTETGM